MSKSATWMPLYIGDYLADTGHLTAQQHGSYLLMLMHQWRTGPLPDDDRQLAAIARVDLVTWKRKISSTVRLFFDVTNDGLVQKRLNREKQRSDQNLVRKSVAGSKGAESRWAKSNSDRNGTRIADALPTHDFANVPSPSERKKERSLRSRAHGGDDPEFDRFWTVYPRKEDKPDAQKAWRAARKDASADEIIEGVRRYPFEAEERYQKLPAGWLRGCRWKRELGTAPVTVAPTTTGHAASDIADLLNFNLGVNVEDAFREEPNHASQAAPANRHALGHEAGPPDGWWEDAPH